MLTPEMADAILARITKIPIFETLEMKAGGFSEGYCEVTVPRRKKYDGVYDSFHGGLLMTVADSAACFAILTMIGPDAVLTTTDMNIRFLAPCLTDLTVKATVIKIGRTMCPVAVDLFDANGRHVAVAQVNYMRMKRTSQTAGENA